MKWQTAIEGEDGKISGKAITAFILVAFLLIILIYAIWFSLYSLFRQSLISENELQAAHYPLELVIPILSLIAALWSVGMIGNSLHTKFTNQPPKGDMNINQPEKVINNP